MGSRIILEIINDTKPMAAISVFNPTDRKNGAVINSDASAYAIPAAERQICSPCQIFQPKPTAQEQIPAIELPLDSNLDVNLVSFENQIHSPPGLLPQNADTDCHLPWKILCYTRPRRSNVGRIDVLNG